MRRVVIYRHQLFRGSEIFITQQAGALSRFAPLYAGRVLEGEPPVGAEVATVGATPPARLRHALTRDPSRIAATLAALAGRDIALVHAHFGVEGVYALPLARRLGVPLVTTFHGFDATIRAPALVMSGRPSWVRYALGRGELARGGRLFIAVSDFIRERVVELGFPAERVATHHIGVDTGAMRPPATPPAEPLVLHVARLVEKKGTRYLIEAFARVVASRPDARLVVGGDGPLRRPLEDQARRRGVASAVRFLGALPHAGVRAWMQRARLICLPSVTARSGDAEGLGMVLLEAAAAGVPAVATRHGGIPEAVADGESGCLVAERDSDGLAERIQWLLDDSSARDAMGQAARRLVEERFDLAAQTRKLEALYEGVL